MVAAPQQANSKVREGCWLGLVVSACEFVIADTDHNHHLLLPEVVEADFLLHHFLARGDVLRYISEQKIHERTAVLLGTHQRRLTRDVYHLRGIGHDRFEIPDIIDQFHRLGLLAGPDLAVGNGLYIVVFHTAAIRDRLDELSKHVVDQRLHVGLLGGCEIARRISRVFKFAGLDDDVLQLGPFQKVAIVHPLCDYADGANNAALVRIDLVAGRSDVERTTGTHRLDRDDNLFLLFSAYALHFPVNLFRRRNSPTRGIHMQNNGLDRRIVTELLQLTNHGLWRENHAVEIDHANAVPEAGQSGFAGSSVQREIYQSKDG